MYKQFMPHESGSSELEYVEQVWSQAWSQKEYDASIDYLRTTDYFRILKRHLKPGMRVLEGGCGQGQWVRILSQLGYKATGIELSRSTVAEVNRRYPELDVRVGDVFHLPFEDGAFDAYLSFGVIEHFEAGPEAVIAEARRVLKPGGLFCVSVPFLNKAKLKRLKGAPDNLGEFAKGTPVRFYQYVMSKAELRDCVERAGFDVLELSPTDAGHTLKTRSTVVSGIAAGTRRNNPLFRAVRPLLRKAWHAYVRLNSQERHAHMIFAICRNAK